MKVFKNCADIWAQFIEPILALKVDDMKCSRIFAGCQNMYICDFPRQSWRTHPKKKFIG